jgi:hypothetical protein
MASVLKSDRISFLCSRNFVYGGHTFSVGDEFPGEEANNIETMVRARFVIPVVDDLADKPRHWHLHVKLREDVEQQLSDGKPVQIVFHEPEQEVDLDALTHPEPEEPNQADHMREVADNRIQAENERRAEEAELEDEETEPEAETEPYAPFVSNEEQLQYPEPEETEPPEEPDYVAESTVPTPEEQAAQREEEAAAEPEPEETHEPEPEPEPAPEPAAEAVPEGTIAVVKEWVGDDPARAQAALEAEEAGQNRTTLIAWLEEVR